MIYIGATDSDGVMSDFSSFGPLADGRLFPTVCAKGAGVHSALPNASYMAQDGTSMACPISSGAIALLQERWHQLHGGKDIRHDLLKATIANTAHDAGRQGPDFEYGYGILDIERSLTLLEKGWYKLDVTSQGKTQSHTIEIPAGAKEVRVMLVWNDPISMDQIGLGMGNRLLINNLDLQVTHGGTEYLPWVCDHTYGNVQLPAERRVDTLNNMEQVTIENPTPGTATITIRGTEIPGSAEQPYALVWYFDMPTRRILYPNAGITLAHGEQERLLLEGFDADYRIELSFDGGKSYTDNREHALRDGKPYSNRFLYLPKEAPLTNELMIRVVDSKGIVESPHPMLLAPRPQGVRIVMNDECSCDGWKLAWENDARATQGYVVLKGDIRTEQFAELGITTVGINEMALPALSEHELTDGVVYSVCCRLADGTIGPRAVGVVPQGAAQYSGPAAGDFYIERFTHLPPPNVKISTGGYVISSWEPNGFNNAHALSLLIANSSREFEAEFTAEFDEYKAQVTICGPDTRSAAQSDSVLVTFHGILNSREIERGANVKVRVLSEGTPLADLQGRQVLSLTEGHEMKLSYRLPSGTLHKLTLEFVGTRERDQLFLTAIEFADDALRRSPTLKIENAKPINGAQLGVEEYILSLTNETFRPIERAVLYAVVNGKVDEARAQTVENWLPNETRTLRHLVDLATDKDFGENFDVEFVLRDAAQNFDVHVKTHAVNKGNVLLMPLSEEMCMMGGCIPLDRFITKKVDGSVLFTDFGSRAENYPTLQRNTLRLVPANPNRILRVTFKHMHLAEDVELWLYTHDIPTDLSKIVESEMWEEERRKEPLFKFIGKGEGEENLAIGHETFLSQDPTGALVFHFRVLGKEARGWEALVEEVPIHNVLTLMSVKAQSLGADNSEEVPLAISIENHYNRPIENASLHITLDGEGKPVIFALDPLKPGANEITIEAAFSLSEEPMWRGAKVHLLSADDHDARDNSRTILIARDRMESVPPLCEGNDEIKISSVDIIGRLSLYLAENHKSYPRLIAQPIELDPSWSKVLTVGLNSILPYDIHLSAWVDADGNNTLEADEIVHTTIPANDFGVDLDLSPLALNFNNAPHRVRIYLGAKTLTPQNANRSELWRDITDLDLTLKSTVPTSTIDDLELVSVEIGRSGAGLSANQAIELAISNHSSQPYTGKVAWAIKTESPISGEKTGTHDCSAEPIEPGESISISLPTTIDLTSRGFHSIEATINNWEGSASGKIFSVVPNSSEPLALAFPENESTNIWLDHTKSVSSLLHSVYGDFTLDFWVKPTANREQLFLQGNSFTLSCTYGRKLPAAKDYGLMLQSDGATVFTTKSCITPEKWNHVAIAFDATNEKVSIYVNGIQIPTTPEMPSSISLADLAINSPWFAGEMDQLRLHDAYRAESDVKAMMYQSLQGDPNCLFEFSFQEGKGNYLATSGKAYVNIMTDETRLSESAGKESVWKGNGTLIGAVRLPGGGYVEKTGVNEFTLTLPPSANRAETELEVSTLWPDCEFTVAGNAFTGRGKVDLSGSNVSLKASLANFFTWSDYSQEATLLVQQQTAPALTRVELLQTNNSTLVADLTIPVAATMPIRLTAEQGTVNPAGVTVNFTLTVGAKLFLNGEESTNLSPTLDLTSPNRITIKNADEKEQQHYILTLQTNQSITWDAWTSDYTFGEAPVDLASVTASSGLPVHFSSSNPSVAVVIEKQLHIVGSGTATITASQPGNALYAPAEPVTHSISVKRANVTITPIAATLKYGESYVPKFDYQGVISEEHADLLRYEAILFIDAEGNAAQPHGLITGEMEEMSLFLAPGTYTLLATRDKYLTPHYEVTCATGTLTVESNPLYAHLAIHVTDSEGNDLPNTTVEIGSYRLMASEKGVIELAGHRDELVRFTIKHDGYLTHLGEIQLTKEQIKHPVKLLKPLGHITYLANKGGYILGNTHQLLGNGVLPTKATALPAPSHNFTQWDDELNTPTRFDYTLRNGEHQFTAEFNEKAFAVNYIAQTGGTISSGEAEQSLKYGEASAAVAVTATEPNSYFAGWDDGQLEAERTGDIITQDTTFTALFGQLQSLPYKYNFPTLTFTEGWHAYTEGDFPILWELRSDPLASLQLDDTYAYCFSGKLGRLYGAMHAYLNSPRIDISATNDALLVSFDYIFTKYQIETWGNITCALEYRVENEEWTPVGKELLGQLPLMETRKKAQIIVPNHLFAGRDYLELRLNLRTVTDYYILIDNFSVEALQPTITYSYAVEPANAGTIEGNPTYSQSLLQHELPDAVTATALPGWRFAMWKENGNTTPTLTHTTRALEDKTFTALFTEVDRYSATIEVFPAGAGKVVQGESEVASAFSWQGEAKIKAIPHPGYTFDRWSYKDEKSSEITLSATAHHENIIAYFTAQPTEVTLTVTGNGTPIAGAEIQLGGELYHTDNQGSITISLPLSTYHYTVSASGYLGYSGTLEVKSEPTKISVQLFRPFYTLTFTKRGKGTLEGDTVQHIPYGMSSTPVKAIPEPTFYEFDSWSDGREESIYVIEKVVAPVALTAHFLGRQCQIEFDANGGTGAVEGVSVRYDEDLTLPQNAFSREGYVFSGWSDKQTGGSVWQPKEEIPASSFVSDPSTPSTLFAQWKKQSPNLAETQTVLLSCHPNPTDGLLYIDNATRGTAQIYSTQGVLVKTQSSTGVVDCSELTPGIYLLRYTTEEGIIYVGRFVKK